MCFVCCDVWRVVCGVLGCLLCVMCEWFVACGVRGLHVACGLVVRGLVCGACCFCVFVLVFVSVSVFSSSCAHCPACQADGTPKAPRKKYRPSCCVCPLNFPTLKESSLQIGPSSHGRNLKKPNVGIGLLIVCSPAM